MSLDGNYTHFERFLYNIQLTKGSESMFWNNWFKTNQSQTKALARDRRREEVKKQDETKNKARKDAVSLYDGITQAINKRLKSDEGITQNNGAYYFLLVYKSNNPLLEDELYREELGSSVRKLLKKDGIFKTKTSRYFTPICFGEGNYDISQGIKIPT